MIIRKELTEQQARAAMESGEFPPEVTESAPNVAIVLTQDWCPQWASMESYLSDAKADSGTDVEVYSLEYNRETYFEEFRTFKERTLGNSLIPYVRYYRGGKLVGESNYLSRGGFIKQFGS